MSDVPNMAPPDGRPRIQSLEEFSAEVMPLLGPAVTSKVGGRFIHDIISIKPKRDWLLKGVLLASTFSLVVGPAGCGKSFLTLDLIMTMALAVVNQTAPREWFGRRIKPCGIVYIAAEGQEDFVIRMHAWMQSHGVPPDTRLPVFLIPTVIDLRTGDAATKVLIEEAKAVAAVMRAEFHCEVGMIVVDTFNRALAGGDDSKPEHVGALIKNCTTIREALSTAVLAIHHTVKSGGRMDPRGHGSIRADNDAEIFVNPAQDGAPNDWRVTRNKAGPAGDRHEFRLRPIEVGRDDNGDPITSCFVAPGAMESSAEGHDMRDAAAAADTKKPFMTADGRLILSGRLTIVMRALHSVIEASGEYPPADVPVPHGRRATTYKSWLDEIVSKMPGDDREGKVFRDRCRKARDAAAERLVNKGVIGMHDDWIWRTGRKVAMVDHPEKEAAPDVTPAKVNENLIEEDSGDMPF